MEAQRRELFLPCLLSGQSWADSYLLVVIEVGGGGGGSVFLAEFFGPCKPLFLEPSPSRGQERINIKLGHRVKSFTLTLRVCIPEGRCWQWKYWQPTQRAVPFTTGQPFTCAYLIATLSLEL